VRERKCTDVFCLLLFITFVVSLVGIAVYGIANGNVDKVLAPYDNQKHFCGHDGYENFPKLYITQRTGSAHDIFNSGLCVAKCPKKGEKVRYISASGENTYPEASPFDTVSVANYCLFELSSMTVEDKAYWTYKVQELLSNPTTAWIQDLYLSSRAIYASMAMAFVYCVLYIYLMSAFAEYIAWAIVGMIQVGFFLGSVITGVAALQYNSTMN